LAEGRVYVRSDTEANVMRTILFRADSSSTIGTGHIMRDLVLAGQFQDAHIIFAVQDLPGNINHKIKEEGYEIRHLSTNDVEELDTLIKKLSIEMLVIDHYEIDVKYEKQLKTQNSTLKIMSLDDTYEKHYCDILLNHNIYADAAHYKGLVPDQCELRCGEKYTLLRDEFIEAKQAKKFLKDKGRQTVFIAMGGSDIANLNPKILGVLEQYENVQVEMVTTTANQHLKALERFVEDKPWVNLHINSNQIAKLMAQSDLAIVTPSVTMNEVWYMEIPFIAIKVADNQTYMYEFLKQNNFTVLEEFDHNKFTDTILKFLKGY
jgi:UDP-2,4-diacetamido-2,4,6-trideoxy-beta-L-altropyranose hydrolase